MAWSIISSLWKEPTVQYGNTKFSFYQMDVDRDSFSADFQKLCTEPEDREFDLICLSFVLMHLHDGEKLLRTLKNFFEKKAE